MSYKDLTTTTYKELAEEIFALSGPFVLTTRSILVDTSKLEKRVDKLTQSTKGDATTFSRVLTAYRRTLKHRNVTPLKPTGPLWTVLKEITGHADAFAQEFEIKNIMEAYREYIRIGMGKMQKFNLTKFLGMPDAIAEYYKAELELKDDTSPGETREVYYAYVGELSRRSGLSVDYKNMPEKYVYFYRVKTICQKHGITYSDYIASQFLAFDSGMGYPDPMQLVGEKAIIRLQRYLIKHNIKIKPIDQADIKVDFKKILNGSTNN